MNLDNHPSVIAFRQRQQNNQSEAMALQRLKAIVLEAGADDVGVVEIDRQSLQDQKEAILHAFPRAKALVTSQNMAAYREKRTDSETMAVWQSLTYGGGYRCGYCMSVCPAGQDLPGPYLDNRNEYIQSVVKPLQERNENVYVLPGQDQATAVSKRFPKKTVRPA